MHREKGLTPLTITLAHPNPPASARPGTPFRPPDAPQRTPRPRHPRPVRPPIPQIPSFPTHAAIRWLLPLADPGSGLVRAEHLGTAAHLESRSDRVSHLAARAFPC